MSKLQKHTKRKDLQKALVVNAATKPANLLIPSVGAAAGIIIGAPIIAMIILAVFFWLGASTFTFFDKNEAEALGKNLREKNQSIQIGDFEQLHPAVKVQYARVQKQFQLLGETIAASQQPLVELQTEAKGLVEMALLASKRASLLYGIIQDDDIKTTTTRINSLRVKPNLTQNETDLLLALKQQQSNLDKAQSQIDEFDVQIERLAVELSAVRSSVATSSSVSDQLLAEKLSDEAGLLRERVNIMQNVLS